MLSCKKAAVLLSQDIDGELGAIAALKLRSHLLICRVCRVLRGQLFLQKRAAHLAGEEDGALPPHVEEVALPEVSRQRIKDLLAEEEK